MLPLSFYNRPDVMTAAYDDAINVFSEGAPYTLETQFVGRYYQTKIDSNLYDAVTNPKGWTATEITEAGTLDAPYPVIVAGKTLHGGTYKEVILFNESFIVKVLNALEDNRVSGMSNAERVVFINYLDYESATLTGSNNVSSRNDITVATSQNNIDAALSVWIMNILIGKSDSNPVSVKSK